MIRARRVGRARRHGPRHGGSVTAGLAGQFDVPCAVGEFVEEHGECGRYEAGGEITQPNLRSHRRLWGLVVCCIAQHADQQLSGGLAVRVDVLVSNPWRFRRSALGEASILCMRASRRSRRSSISASNHLWTASVSAHSFLAVLKASTTEQRCHWTPGWSWCGSCCGIVAPGAGWRLRGRSPCVLDGTSTSTSAAVSPATWRCLALASSGWCRGPLLAHWGRGRCREA